MKIDNDNFAEDKDKSSDSNESVSNNSLCPVCGGDHNVLVISLVHGGHIVIHSFPKERATKVKVTNGGKRRATRLDLVDIFWPAEEEMNDV